MVTKEMDKEAAARVVMDSFSHHQCSKPHLVGMQIRVDTTPAVDTTRLGDACKTVPATQDRTVREMDKTMVMVTVTVQMEMKTTRINIILAIGLAGVAPAGMVDPVEDQAEDLVADLLEVGDLPAVDLLADLLVDPVATPEDLADLGGQTDQGGQVA